MKQREIDNIYHIYEYLIRRKLRQSVFPALPLLSKSIYYIIFSVALVVFAAVFLTYVWSGVFIGSLFATDILNHFIFVANKIDIIRAILSLIASILVITFTAFAANYLSKNGTILAKLILSWVLILVGCFGVLLSILSVASLLC